MLNTVFEQIRKWFQYIKSYCGLVLLRYTTIYFQQETVNILPRKSQSSLYKYTSWKGRQREYITTVYVKRICNGLVPRVWPLDSVPLSTHVFEPRLRLVRWCFSWLPFVSDDSAIYPWHPWTGLEVHSKVNCFT